MNSPSGVPSPPGDGDDLLLPISLELSPIRNLLIIDVADDPTYRTLEPQVLEEPGGDAVVLLVYRHDGHVELYAPSGSAVDASGYDGLGEGLAGLHHAPFEQARFEITEDGLQLDLVVTATNGRRFDLHIHEHLTGGRDRFPVLAPVGGTFDTPTFFPFLWLPGLSFVPVRGTELDVRVDGKARNVPRIPLPIGGRRCLMARYDPDVLVCQFNPDSVRVAPRVPVRADHAPGDADIDIVEVEGRSALAAIRVARGGHTCAVVLDPPLPDLRSLPVHTRRSGAVLLQADGTTELQARYELRRAEDGVEVVIEGFGPWRTRLRRPLLALLFRLPVFRRWPTTYRWEATVELGAGSPHAVHSRWSRSPDR